MTFVLCNPIATKNSLIFDVFARGALHGAYGFEIGGDKNWLLNSLKIRFGRDETKGIPSRS